MSFLDQNLVRALLNNLDHADMIFDLAERWRDERNHESLADYAKALSPFVHELATIEKMTTRPFGYIVKMPAGTRWHIQLRRNNLTATLVK